MAVSMSAARRSATRHALETCPVGKRFDRPTGIGITVTAAPGQTIVVEGDPIEGWFRIASGAVRLSKSTPDGRRQVIDFLIAGESFGIASEEHYGYTVEAIARTTLVRHSRARLEAAIEAQPELARRLFGIACADLQRARQHLLLLGRKSADEKIASFLLSLAARLGSSDVVQLPMSRQDMADYLGLTIETVSRTLTRLRHRGLIALRTPQQVVLLRADRLRGLAEGA
jgi:CRP/FNR family transcriptional regulator, anaerobic regulatory protein